MILKTRKQICLIVTAVTCMAFTPLAAQSKSLKDSTPEQRAKMQTEWMKTKLALNSTQIQQVYDLNLEYARKNDPILQSNDGKLAKFKKLKALQKEKSSVLSKILNEEQYKKYQEIKDQLVQNFKNKRK
ncbi:hypothetical protein [Flavobacterium sp. B17]|uniref:hypothetical protein n=1 Tax=Flavobacterium sp. B17 TaxID=95618 RepID=UPI00034D64CE|nr:hypothetical protein [Flavobacterium sp. B17]